VRSKYNLFPKWKYFNSEISVDESTLSSQAREFIEIFRKLVRLRHRARGLLPGGLTDLKTRLEETYPKDEFGRGVDYGLLYYVGATLSSQQGSITMGELSRSMDVPLSTATRMVDWLEKGGFVERLPDPNDRRIVRVELTETGETIYHAAQEIICRRIEKSLACFTISERENLLFLLYKLVKAMEEE
jgi:DNA-binding MarR family transcriptional regulator